MTRTAELLAESLLAVALLKARISEAELHIRISDIQPAVFGGEHGLVQGAREQ